MQVPLGENLQYLPRVRSPYFLGTKVGASCDVLVGCGVRVGVIYTGVLVGITGIGVLVGTMEAGLAEPPPPPQ